MWSDGFQPAAAEDGWTDGQTGLVSSSSSQLCLSQQEGDRAPVSLGRGTLLFGRKEPEAAVPTPKPHGSTAEAGAPGLGVDLEVDQWAMSRSKSEGQALSL